MGQILHKCATTTHRIRAEIQRSKESASVLAKKFGINIKTVYKWKKREAIIDDPMGAKKLRTVLSELEELAIWSSVTERAICRHFLLDWESLDYKIIFFLCITNG